MYSINQQGRHSGQGAQVGTVNLPPQPAANVAVVLLFLFSEGKATGNRQHMQKKWNLLNMHGKHYG